MDEPTVITESGRKKAFTTNASGNELAEGECTLKKPLRPSVNKVSYCNFSLDSSPLRASTEPATVKSTRYRPGAPRDDSDGSLGFTAVINQLSTNA